MKSITLSCGLLATLALSACGQSSQADVPAEAAHQAPQGPADSTKPFPALQVTTVDGQAYDLAAQRGHWVVVNFWATWCKPCLKEMPDLSAMAEQDADKLRVIGLAYDDVDDAELAAFMQANPVSYPVAKVDVYAPPADFETPRGLPMTYLIAPDGRVVERFLGPVTSGQLRQAIARGGAKQAG